MFVFGSFPGGRFFIHGGTTGKEHGAGGHRVGRQCPMYSGKREVPHPSPRDRVAAETCLSGGVLCPPIAAVAAFSAVRFCSLAEKAHVCGEADQPCVVNLTLHWPSWRYAASGAFVARLHVSGRAVFDRTRWGVRLDLPHRASPGGGGSSHVREKERIYLTHL